MVFLSQGPLEKLQSVAYATTISSCDACHGKPPLDGVRDGSTGKFLGTHTVHTGMSTVTRRYAFACTKCHYDNGTNYVHENGFINITGSSLNGSAYTSVGYSTVRHRKRRTNTPSLGTCSTIYCHSNGRTDKPQYNTPTWGGPSLDCLACHGGRASATGNYTYSNLGYRLSTTHSQHLKYPAANINCNICHSKTLINDARTLKPYTAASRHNNGVRDVTFTGITYGSYSSYKTTATGSGANTKKCGNVSCHGGTTRAAWSTTTTNNDNTCVHCHGTAGTSTSVTNSGDNRKFFAPGWNGAGNDTDGDKNRANFQVGAHFKHLSSIFMKKIKCNECHYVPTTPFDGTTHMAQPRFTVSKTIIFDQASTATISTGVASGSTPSVLAVGTFSGFTSGSATKAATCSSVYCHGNRLKNGTTNGSYRKPYWNYSGMTNNSSDKLAVTCGRCHGNPPNVQTSSHSGKTATTSCNGCHGSVVDALGNIINKSLHINGRVEATGCTGCHGNPPTYGGNMVSSPSITNALGGSNFNAHSTHVKRKKMVCNVCHNGNSTTMGNNYIELGFAINGTNFPSFNAGTQVTFGSFSGNSNLSNGYSYAAGSGQTGTSVQTGASTRNSCNVYCHGGWTGSKRALNPSWALTSQTTCGNCHAATVAAPPTNGSHNKHVATYQNSCTTCHPGRYVGDDHVKGTVHWKFSTAIARVGTSAAYTRTGASGNGTASGTTNALASNGSYGSCSTIYCHSNGRVDKPQYNSPTWGNNGITCLGCHGGRDSALGTYTFSVGGFKLSTTHSQHLKYPAANINCNICHSKTAIDAATLQNYSGKYVKHANAVKDVTFTSITYGSYSSYKIPSTGSGANTKKCGNVSCHGGITRNSWSTTTTNNDNTCVHCHGTAGTSTAVTNSGDNRKFFAPGWNKVGIDTDGDTSRQNYQVGAHFKHLSSAITRKIKCNECHLVPSSPFDGTTHMAQPRFSVSKTLIFSQSSTATISSGVSVGSTPTVLAPGVFSGYTSGTVSKAATCSSVYCHGNRLKYGDTAGTYKKPYWNYSGMTTNAAPSVNSCSRCHGAPPNTVTASHSGVTAITQCSNCHGGVVDNTGKIINKTKHINGVIDVPTGCNGCHYYDTADWSSGTRTEMAVDSFGAHATHIAYLKQLNNVSLVPATDTFGGTSFNAVCGVCHTRLPSNHQDSTRLINFGDGVGGTYPNKFGTANPLYNGTPGIPNSTTNKTCSNLDCHYKTTPVWP
jgi:predicted CxxxxCH...CXXCH cytochrome family protein